MMERRQMWLEEQFLQQGKDLLRLSRQIHVIQDFITLHFDSFRDYSMERERGDMRLDDKSNNTGESEPGGNRYSQGLHRSLSPYPPNSMHNVPYCTPPIVTADQNGHYESQGMLQQIDNPVDLSEYPSSSDFVPHQRPISPLDLSVSSSNWDTSYNKNHPGEDEPLRNLAHHQSPSPILSRSSLPHDVTPEGFQFKSEVEVSDRETSEEDNDVTYPHSSSSRNSLHPNSSSYDSVLRSILRTDPPISAKIKYEQMNATLPVRSYNESSQLHWSSGTVTSSAAASTSIQSPGYLGPANYNNEESEPGNIIGGGGGGVMTIKREDSALDYERQGRTACLISDELGRVLPSADSAIISKSEPEDYSLTKTKGRKPKRPKSSTSSKTLTPAKPKKPKSTRQGRNTSTPNSGGTVESSSSSGQGSKKCRFCGKTFQWSHSVKTHERLHTGDKPYLCKMCGTRFTQNGNLKVHAKTCVGKYADMYKSKNIFVCPLCTEMFQTMDELMSHQKSHDRMQWSDKDKTCRFCGKMFQKRSLLLTHELVHTNDQEDEEDMNENDSISEGGRSKQDIIRFDGNSNTGSSGGGGGGGGVGGSGKVGLLDNHGINCMKDIPTLHNGTMVPCSNASADGNNPDDDSFADDSD